MAKAAKKKEWRRHKRHESGQSDRYADHVGISSKKEQRAWNAVVLSLKAARNPMASGAEW